MANLRIYHNQAPAGKPTENPAAAAARKSGPANIAATVTAGLGAMVQTMGKWHEENRKNEAFARTSMLMGDAATTWENVNSQAVADGFYEIDGEQYGLIEGRLRAFEKHHEALGTIIGQIEDETFRTAATEAHQKQYITELSKEHAAYREGVMEVQGAAVAMNAERLAKSGQMEAAQGLIDQAVANGIYDRTEGDTVSKNTIVSARTEDYRGQLLAADDPTDVIAAVQADTYLDENAKDELIGEAYEARSRAYTESQRADKERQANNEMEFLANNDPSNFTNAQLAQMDLPPATIIAFQKANIADAASPPKSSTAALNLANDILTSVSLMESGIGEAKAAISTIEGLSPADRRQMIAAVNSAANVALNDPLVAQYRELMSVQILKVPSESFLVTKQNSELWILQQQMETEMYRDMLAQGASFNPVTWYDEKKAYYTETAEKIQNGMKERKEGWVVTDASGEILQLEETKQNLMREYPNDPDKQQTLLREAQQQYGG